MNFGQALEALKLGSKVSRDGWNGKGVGIPCNKQTGEAWGDADIKAAYLAAIEYAARIAEDGYFDIPVGPNDEVCDVVELTRATIAAAIRGQGGHGI